MIQLLQEFDLSKCRDRETILLMVHQNLLEGHNLTCLFRSRLRDFTECAFSEFAYVVVLLDLGAATKSGLAIVEPFQGLTRGICFCRHLLEDLGADQRQADVAVMSVRMY